MDGNEKVIAITSGLLSLAVTWAWHFATAQNQELAAWILVSAIMLASLVAMGALLIMAIKTIKASDGNQVSYWTLSAALVAFVSFLSFTIICIFYWVDEGIDGQVAAQVRETFPDLVVDPPIRRNIRLAEAPSHGTPIHIHAPKSAGGQDYLNLSNALMKVWGFGVKDE